MSDVSTPRLMYRGAADETAETREAIDQADLAAALKAGWRLTRVDADHQPPEKVAEPEAAPAADATIADKPAAKAKK